MSVLHGWNGTHVANAAELIVQAAEHRLQASKTPWSLIELNFDDADAALLINWLRALHPATLSSGLKGFGDSLVRWDERNMRVKAVWGLVSLATIAMVVREHGTADAVWPAVARVLADRPELSAQLLAGGQPHERLTNAIGVAVHAFRLRSALHLASSDAQIWYHTVRLQSGVSKPSVEQALARWLVGPTPMFVQLLLNDPDQQDRGFRDMWGHLRSLKEGKISRDVARAALRRSPWLPSECIDRALDAAVKARTVVAPATELVSADERPWVLGPMLRDTPRGPEAHACIPANFGDDFGQDVCCVTLRVDGEPQRKLFRQQSGRYAPDDGEVLHLGRGAVWVVDATTRGGEVLRSSVLALLGEGELLAAFDAATGVRESPPFPQQRALFLVADRSVTFDPVLQCVAKLGDCAVLRLPAWTQWQAKLGDDVLGSSRQPAPLVRRPPRAQEPPGLYLYDGMGWVKHAPDTVIECADVRNRPVQIRLDGLSEHARVLLFEDSRLRFFPGHSRPMHLHDVVGLGGPLDAQITRYDDRREMVRLASALVDHGDIDAATLAGGELRLRLRKAKELEDRTHVAIWETSGNYLELPVTVGNQAVQEIRVPYEGPGLVAVALIVEDYRTGAWWSDDWHQVLSRVEDAQVSQVVERMYSMRLPMLAMPHRAVVGQWLARHAAAVLECLLANDSLASELGSLLCTATLRASDVRGIEDFARGMTTAADGVPRVLLLHEVVGEALLAIHPVAFASYYDQLVEMWRPAPRNQNLARIVRRLLLLKETTANSKFWTQAQRLVGEPSRYGKWRDALASQDTYLDVARALHAARQRGNFGSWLLMDKWSDALH